MSSEAASEAANECCEWLRVGGASGLPIKLGGSGNILCDLAHRSPSFRRYLSCDAVVKRIKVIAYSRGGKLEKVLLLQTKTPQSWQCKGNRRTPRRRRALQAKESIIFDTTQSALKRLGLSIQCPEAVIKLIKRLTPKNTVCFRPIIVPKIAQRRQASPDTLVNAVVCV